MVWKPNVTVAAVVEQQGRFLLVEETTADGVRLNQPAGHLEEGESLLAAVVRETREETCRAFTPQAMLGIYRLPLPTLTYLRVAVIGSVGEADPALTLDDGILRTVWLTADELRAQPARLRSPLVLRCVEDYLAGQRFPLSVLVEGA